jgi:hypothetical protein
MFNLLRRSAPRYPTIRQTLANAGLLSSTDPDALTVLERHGSYSGRGVNFFRAFNPTDATAGAIRVRTYGDLDAHQELVLGSGHVESNGLVMLNSQPEQTHPVPNRELADRAAHADDHHLVFWDAEAARSSGVTLSRPAAGWLHAQSTADERHVDTTGHGSIPDTNA